MSLAGADPPDSRMRSASTSEDDEDFRSLLAFAKALGRRPQPEMADWYLKFKRLMRDVRITSSHDEEFEEHLFARIEAECTRDVAESFMSTYAIRSRRWDVKAAQALVEQATNSVKFYKDAVRDITRATPNPNVRDRIEDFLALNATLRNAEESLTRAEHSYDAAVIRYDEAYRTRQIRPLRAPHSPPRNVAAQSGPAVVGNAPSTPRTSSRPSRGQASSSASVARRGHPSVPRADQQDPPSGAPSTPRRRPPQGPQTPTRAMQPSPLPAPQSASRGAVVESKFQRLIEFTELTVRVRRPSSPR
ncbi:hypothetical protein C8Q73DRAFT_796402 [Cubamyces lactineus]|nr:hypothetical protein C8Q73DRAFT_796402 [Cubamyces lactineus]